MIDPLPIAAAGEVGEDFFREREAATLPCQATDAFFCWDWARENIDRYGEPAVQHLELVVISVVLGFAIAFALAVLAHRRRLLRAPLLGVTGVLYTIPSVAFFFLLIPITGFGRDSAIIALTAYTLQIIYRNATTGLDNVPEDVKDAARGMGFSERQILWKIEVPIATPEIVAGLQIATVSTVAIASLSALIGAGGLGQPILDFGISFLTNIILAGGLMVLMAIALGLVLWVIQRQLTPWRRAVRQ